MLDFRPHIMTWTTRGESTTDPDTGYEIPGVPGETKSVPCRFHLGGIKEFRNEDNTVVQQKGRIRIDVGIEIPEIGQTVNVIGHFQGVIRDVFKGQLSWRLDV